MDDFEKSLRVLSQTEPNENWLHQSKGRLMESIALEQEEAHVQTWFAKAGSILPRASFLNQARLRLINHIYTSQGESALWNFPGLRRLLGSVLVMVLAVSTTLLFVDGQPTVVADNNARLEVLYGEVKVQDDLEWQSANNWREIQEGDLMRTSPNTDAIIHFSTDNQLRLGPNTTLLVTELDDENAIIFHLPEGSAWLQVPGQQQKTFVSIETPSASILTPKASLLVRAEPLASSTSIFNFSGASKITHLDWSVQETKVDVLSPHESLTLSGKKGTEGVVAFDVQEAQKDPEVQKNLLRDQLQERHLEEMNLKGLKNVLMELDR